MDGERSGRDEHGRSVGEGNRPDGGGRPGELLGTPPPGTVPGGQQAGRETGMQPADPDEAED